MGKALNGFFVGLFQLIFVLVLMAFCIGGAVTILSAASIMQQIAGILLLGFGMLISTAMVVANKQLELLREIRDYMEKLREAADLTGPV